MKENDILSVVNADEINDDFINDYEDGTDLVEEERPDE